MSAIADLLYRRPTREIPDDEIIEAHGLTQAELAERREVERFDGQLVRLRFDGALDLVRTHVQSRGGIGTVTDDVVTAAVAIVDQLLEEVLK